MPTINIPTVSQIWGGGRGKWVEYRLFSAVVLFHRGESDADVCRLLLAAKASYSITTAHSLHSQWKNDAAPSLPPVKTPDPTVRADFCQGHVHDINHPFPFPFPFCAERLTRRVGSTRCNNAPAYLLTTFGASTNQQGS
jgi:hypothetical protein